MRIAVIGTGNVGASIGSGWRKAGYDVVFGARNARDTGPDGMPVLAVSDALTGADVVLLAVPGGAVPDLVAAQGAALAGKVVIDAVNRIGEPEINSRALIAEAAPDVQYVRAFNTLGWENFADPLPGANLFFAADPGARSAAEELIAAIGLDPTFVGDAAAAATVDALLPLWFALVQARGGNRKLAFALVTES
jgi:hypothetical protein